MQPPFPSPVPTWHNDIYPTIDPGQNPNTHDGKTVIITGAVSERLSNYADIMYLHFAFHLGKRHWARNRSSLPHRRGQTSRLDRTDRRDSGRDQIQVVR
jgi:hypothetical protein